MKRAVSAEQTVSGPVLAVIWHSRTGTAEAIAKAVHAGAQGRAILVAADVATPEMLLEVSGYVFVCPENLGTMTGAMKEMFDRCYYPLLGRVEGRPYATVIAAGTDGAGAQAQVDRIVTGWRLRRVAEPMILRTGAQTPAEILAPKHPASEQLESCRQLGEAMAEGLSLGVF